MEDESWLTHMHTQMIVEQPALLCFRASWPHGHGHGPVFWWLRPYGPLEAASLQTWTRLIVLSRESHTFLHNLLLIHVRLPWNFYAPNRPLQFRKDPALWMPITVHMNHSDSLVRAFLSFLFLLNQKQPVLDLIVAGGNHDWDGQITQRDGEKMRGFVFTDSAQSVDGLLGPHRQP